MGGGIGAFLPMLIVIGGMMFFMTRSQKKQQNQRQELLDSLKVGDKVVTIGGLHGVIAEINPHADKNTVLLDCEGIFLEFNRSAIQQTAPNTVVAKETPVEQELIEETEEVPSEVNEEVTVVEPEDSESTK